MRPKIPPRFKYSSRVKVVTRNWREKYLFYLSLLHKRPRLKTMEPPPPLRLTMVTPPPPSDNEVSGPSRSRTGRIVGEELSGRDRSRGGETSLNSSTMSRQSEALSWVSPTSIPKEVVEGVNVPEVLGVLRRTTEKARIIIGMWDNQDVENVDELVDESNVILDRLETRSVELRMLKSKGLFRTLARIARVQRRLENVILDLMAIQFRRAQRAGNTSSPKISRRGGEREEAVDSSLSRSSEGRSSHGPNPSESDNSFVVDNARILEPVVQVIDPLGDATSRMSNENLHQLADILIRGIAAIAEPTEGSATVRLGTVPQQERDGQGDSVPRNVRVGVPMASPVEVDSPPARRRDQVRLPPGESDPDRISTCDNQKTDRDRTTTGRREEAKRRSKDPPVEKFTESVRISSPRAPVNKKFGRERDDESQSLERPVRKRQPLSESSGSETEVEKSPIRKTEQRRIREQQRARGSKTERAQSADHPRQMVAQPANTTSRQDGGGGTNGVRVGRRNRTTEDPPPTSPQHPVREEGRAPQTIVTRTTRAVQTMIPTVIAEDVVLDTEAQRGKVDGTVVSVLTQGWQ